MAKSTLFTVAILVLMTPIVVSIRSAMKAGWFWKLTWNQRVEYARRLSPGTTHFFEVWSHWGFRVAIPLNFLLAWAFAESWPKWDSLTAIIVFPLSFALAIVAMLMWAQADNDPRPEKHVLSGFAINGKLTLPGWCLTLTMALTYMITVMHYLSAWPTNTWFSLVFATALTIALAAGLLQPPYYVWSKIHFEAKLQSLIFGVLVWGLFFAHKLGYVIHA